MQESPQALASWHKHPKQRGHHWTKVVSWRTSCMRSLVDLVAGTKSSELLSTSPKGHSAFDGQWMFIIPNQNSTHERKRMDAQVAAHATN